MKLLFEPETTLPHSDHVWFDICNNAENHWIHKQSFFGLKAKMMDKYGTKAGIAKQTIEKDCNSCGGTGIHWSGRRCHNCDNGIYQRRTFFLQRWVMNGSLYFVPIKYDISMGAIIQEIDGHVYHEPVKGINPNIAYAALTYKYDRDMFNEFLLLFQKRLSKHDWNRWGEICKGKANFIETLAAWYGNTIDPTETKVDDLPF